MSRKKVIAQHCLDKLYFSLYVVFFLIGKLNLYAQDKLLTIQIHDGPSTYTNEILKVLEKYNAYAIFCVTGKNIEKYPEKLKNIFMRGHLICNHSYSHPSMNTLPEKMIKKELSLTNKLINKYTAITEWLFSPPFGIFNKKYLRSIATFHNSKLITFSHYHLYYIEKNFNIDLAKAAYKFIKMGMDNIVLHENLIGRRIREFDNLLSKIVDAGYKIFPDRRYFLNPLKILFTKGNRVTKNVKVINDELNKTNSLYLIFYDLSSHFSKYLSFINRNKIKAHVSIVGQSFFVGAYLFPLVKKFNIKPLLTRNDKDFNCSNLNTNDLKQIKETQTLVFALTNQLLTETFIPCGRDRIKNDFLHQLTTLGISKVVLSTKWFGGKWLNDVSLEMIKRNIIKSVKNNTTIFDDEELEQLIEEFFTFSRLKVSFRKMLNTRIKEFSRSVIGGDIIIINTWNPRVFYAFKKLIKLLQRRGFQFDYLK